MKGDRTRRILVIDDDEISTEDNSTSVEQEFNQKMAQMWLKYQDKDGYLTGDHFQVKSLFCLWQQEYI